MGGGLGPGSRLSGCIIILLHDYNDVKAMMQGQRKGGGVRLFFF